MAEEKKLCKMCKWFTPTQSWDPRMGECKRPMGEGETLSTQTQVVRRGGKFIPRDQDASNCPYFEWAERTRAKDVGWYAEI